MQLERQKEYHIIKTITTYYIALQIKLEYSMSLYTLRLSRGVYLD